MGAASRPSDPRAGPGPYRALLLRPWTESDAPGLRAAIDEDVDHLRPWLSWTLEEPTTVQRTRARLRRWADELRREEGARYAITPRDRPDLILGGAHLNRRVGPEARDIGYWVRRSAARQGIASAAVARLVIHAFDDRAIARIVARCDVANTASASFARALGFELAGHATLSYPDGAPRPVVELEMRRDGYRRHGPALRQRARRVELAVGGG